MLKLVVQGLGLADRPALDDLSYNRSNATLIGLDSTNLLVQHGYLYLIIQGGTCDGQQAVARLPCYNIHTFLIEESGYVPVQEEA